MGFSKKFFRQIKITVKISIDNHPQNRLISQKKESSLKNGLNAFSLVFSSFFFTDRYNFK